MKLLSFFLADSDNCLTASLPLLPRIKFYVQLQIFHSEFLKTWITVLLLANLMSFIFMCPSFFLWILQELYFSKECHQDGDILGWPKISFNFFIGCCGKTQMNLLANSIDHLWFHYHLTRTISNYARTRYHWENPRAGEWSRIPYHDHSNQDRLH